MGCQHDQAIDEVKNCSSSVCTSATHPTDLAMETCIPEAAASIKMISAPSTSALLYSPCSSISPILNTLVCSKIAVTSRNVACTSVEKASQMRLHRPRWLPSCPKMAPMARKAARDTPTVRIGAPDPEEERVEATASVKRMMVFPV